MVNTNGLLKSQAHRLHRTGLASVFLFHGIVKVANLSGFATMMELPFNVAVLVTVAEMAAGVGIPGGVLRSDLITRSSIIAMIPVLVGAIALAHGPRWSFLPAEGLPIRQELGDSDRNWGTVTLIPKSGSLSLIRT